MNLHPLAALASLRKFSPICHPIALSIGFIVVTALHTECALAAYTFTNIADTDGIFATTTQAAFGLGRGQVSLNNSGTVAFSSFLDDGNNGVFSGNGGPITTIALGIGPIFSRGVGGASINSAGTVAFRGNLASGEGVFTGSGGPVTAIALSTEPGFSNGFNNPVINDAGTVGFQVYDAAGSASILTRSGGSTTTIAAESGPIFNSVGGHLSMNATGTVAFLGGLENGQGGFFTGSGGPPTVVTLGLFSGQAIGVSAINDAGSVTFIPNSGDAVYVRDGFGLRLVADTSGPFSGFGKFSSINNSGKVVFFANLDGGGSGIFTGPDPVADKVIRVGDILFGGPVSRVTMLPDFIVEDFGNTDINDAGQVAFHYETNSSLQGIAVATPTVPEPGVLLSGFIGVILLAARRARTS